MPISFMFSKNEETPLNIACKEHRWNIKEVKFLLENGANVNVKFKVRFIIVLFLIIFWFDHLFRMETHPWNLL